MTTPDTPVQTIGAGPMTLAMMLTNIVEIAERQLAAADLGDHADHVDDDPRLAAAGAVPQ